MFALMKAHQDGKLCKVEENDDLSTTATLKEGILTITLINEKYDQERPFSFPLKGKVQEAVVYTSDDVLPYSYFSTSPLQVKADRKGISTILPPHSVALLRIKMK